ncbi:uncharacterized protein LOC124291462 [Haliotis rubra]|uniref:uncharacterized protein LOC124291462 n=1 Tax=Haliotis rubra TaxID=36100 RepID=UPI001EE57D06|nr:uncharacterized protein LOC124291462 [Haliotis rubra]
MRWIKPCNKSPLRSICDAIDMDMDAKSDDSYNSPAEDENTAIERSFMNLRDIEVRCMKAARMCYASSSTYEHNGFYIRCVGAVAFGVTSSLSGPVIEHFVKPYTQSHILDSEFLLYLIGTGLAIVIFFGVVRAVEKAIGAWYDEKAPKFNEAAAEWQELELRIKAFLAAAVKDTITVSDDSYNSPAKDENTAIERSLMNLRDIEARCMRAAPMCYASSSEYEDKGFKIRCAGAAASGGISLFSGFAGSAVMEPVVKHYSQVLILRSKYFPRLTGFGIGIATFFGMLQATDRVIGTWYYEKAPKYNKAAAVWQELELRIKAFLAAAVKDTITVQACKEFTDECAKKRKDICLIARPDQEVYKKFESDNERLIKRLENIRDFHQKRREKRLFSC